MFLKEDQYLDSGVWVWVLGLGFCFGFTGKVLVWEDCGGSAIDGCWKRSEEGLGFNGTNNGFCYVLF